MRRAVLLSLLLLLPNLAVARERDRDHDDAASCEDVRRVRAMAARQGLDQRVFETLEASACRVATPPPQPQPKPKQCPLPPSQASGDCADLYRMSLLAYIAGSDDVVAAIESQRIVTCTIGSSPRSYFDWPNGRTAKYGTSWDYPNGRTAKYGSSWDWPNGRTAKYGSSWDYPNGVTAKYGGGMWQAPNGRFSSLTEVLSWSCEKVGREECLDSLGRIERLSGDEKDLAVIGLAWRAAQR